jgi:hypothetical protein
LLRRFAGDFDWNSIEIQLRFEQLSREVSTRITVDNRDNDSLAKLAGQLARSLDKDSRKSQQRSTKTSHSKPQHQSENEKNSTKGNAKVNDD